MYGNLNKTCTVLYFANDLLSESSSLFLSVCYVLNDILFFPFQIWMLTGDKLETATCIAKSSHLVSRNQDIHVFKAVCFFCFCPLLAS